MHTQDIRDSKRVCPFFHVAQCVVRNVAEQQMSWEKLTQRQSGPCKPCRGGGLCAPECLIKSFHPAIIQYELACLHRCNSPALKQLYTLFL